MPLAEFSGTRNWGYDGVMPFAPDAAYGSPDDLKRLIDEAHGRGLMMFLDVVYNHFGPDGNYLHRYAESFFDAGRAHAVGRRDQLQGRRGARLRHAQRAVLARGVPLRRPALRRRRPDHRPRRGAHPEGDRGHRAAHDPRRAARPSGARERQQRGASARARRERSAGLLRCAVERRHPPRLSPPADWRGGRLLRRLRQRRARAPGARRSAPASSTRATSPTIGTARCAASRARICRRPRSSPSSRTTIRSATARSASASPTSPRAMRSRRCRRFSCSRRRSRSCSWAKNGARPSRSASSPISTTSWPMRCARAGGASSSGSPSSRAQTPARISPIPNAWSTFAASRLDWSVPEQPEHAEWLELVRGLLRMRHETIVPRLGGIRGHAGKATLLSDSALRVAWTLADGSTLELIANLADRMSLVTLARRGRGRRAVREPSGPAGRAARRAPAAVVGPVAVAPARLMSARDADPATRRALRHRFELYRLLRQATPGPAGDRARPAPGHGRRGRQRARDRRQPARGAEAHRGGACWRRCA